jgi:hypothetical protein
VATGCHPKKRYNAPLLEQRTETATNESVGKGSSCRSGCRRPFNPRLLCAAGIPRCNGTGKHECLGATTPALVARCVRCAFVHRIWATLLPKVCVRQTKYGEFGIFLDRGRSSGSSDFISPGNCHRDSWIVSGGLEWRKESPCRGWSV